MRLELSEATSCYQWVHDTRCCSSENRVVGLIPTDCVSVLRTIDMIGLRPAAQRGTLSASCSGEVSAAMHIPTDSTRSRSRLYVRGPLRLLNEDGVDCTPKGGFRKALLALLVLSENQCRGRAWLQSVSTCCMISKVTVQICFVTLASYSKVLIFAPLVVNLLKTG